MVYSGNVRIFCRRVFLVCFIAGAASVLPISEWNVSSASAQKPTVVVEPIRTEKQAKELITKLTVEIESKQSILKSSEQMFEVADLDVEEIRANLAIEQRKAIQPAVGSFIVQDEISASDSNDSNDSSAQIRSKYLSAKVVAADQESIGRIREAQLKLDISEAELASLGKRKDQVESDFAETKNALEAEQGWLGKINEKAIHERGREGATKALAATQSRGKKPGFYLDTCPVDGQHNAIDSWRAPRSSGRLHQGIDIMSPRGTPVVAPVSGKVTLSSSGLGGLSFRLTSNVNNNYYYGTHLNSFEGSSRTVRAGEIIGYVGNTGNARGTAPHLHFEIHPGGRTRGGRSAINPTPDSAKVCRGVNANKKWNG